MWKSLIACAAAAVAVYLAAAPAAWAQPVRSDWVAAGVGDWDDPLLWTWPAGGAPPEGYPHDGSGGLYDCRLSGGSAAAASVRDDVGVFDVLVEQELHVLDNATLTITAPLDDPDIPWGPTAPSQHVCGLNVGVGGEVHVFAGSSLVLSGVATAPDATDPGHLLIEGTLHFQPGAGPLPPGGTPCAITGGGVVELAGGTLSSDADVVHQYNATIRGYGRIAASLQNEYAIAADVAGQWLRFDTNDTTSTEDGVVEAKNGGKLAIEGIQFENRGWMDVYSDSYLLVDAAPIDCKGAGAVVVHGTLELRHGGAIRDCGPTMTADLDSVIDVGVTDLGGGSSLAPNEFALPALNLGGTLNVRNPAPGTGADETILTMNGHLVHSGAVDIGPGARMVTQGLFTQYGGSTVVDGLLVAEGGRVRINDGALTINTAAGAAIDLTVNNLIVDYATTNPYDAIEAFVTSGIGNTTTRPWDGPGINSGDADATLFALGILDNANPPTVVAPFNDTTRLFEGEGVDSTSVLVKYTYYGDANLDGVVSPLDVQRLILSWNGQTEGDPRWAVGDFNYDNLISPFDVQLLILGWNGQGGALAGGSPACPLGFSARAGGGMPAPTPEPATLALLGLGAAGSLLLRRRSR